MKLSLDTQAAWTILKVTEVSPEERLKDSTDARSLQALEAGIKNLFVKGALAVICDFSSADSHLTPDQRARDGAFVKDRFAALSATVWESFSKPFVLVHPEASETEAQANTFSFRSVAEALEALNSGRLLENLERAILTNKIAALEKELAPLITKGESSLLLKQTKTKLKEAIQSIEKRITLGERRLELFLKADLPYSAEPDAKIKTFLGRLRERGGLPQ